MAIAPCCARQHPTVESPTSRDQIKATCENARPLLHAGLDPKYQRVYAKYFARFISAYKAHGINMWGVTVQNEAEAADVTQKARLESRPARAFKSLDPRW
jgi:hypothetical protein